MASSTEPGLLHRLGHAQRFADVDGNLIDVYQATTQMTDESGQAYPATVNTLLDRATGPLGYYGAFTVNAHTDSATSSVWDSVVASAESHDVPVVTAKQMLDWTDGRNATTFDAMTWDGTSLGFSLAGNAQARGMQVMVPATSADGKHLTSLTLDGEPVEFATETRKGVEYAVFAAGNNGLGGDYVATFTADTAGPTITDLVAAPHSGGTATISWTTDEPSSSHVAYGVSAGSLNQSEDDPALVTAHTVELTGLTAGTTYHYRVSSTNAAANTSTSPVPPGTATLVVPSFAATQTTVADFGVGTLGACRTGRAQRRR